MRNEHSPPAFPTAFRRQADGESAQAAARQFVLAFLLTIKNASIYGVEHPIVRRSSLALPDLLEGAFVDGDWVVLQVGADGLRLDGKPLGPSNPIWTQAADTLSALGIATLRLGRDLGGDETAALVRSLSRARSERLAPTDARLLIEQAQLEHVHIDYLRDLLRFRERSEVARPTAAAGPTSTESYRVTPLDQEEERILADIRRLVPELPVELRDQLHAAARGREPRVSAPAGEARPRPVRESLLAGLRQLTEQGEGIPESVYRTLRVLFDLGPPEGAADQEGSPITAESARDLLEGLLADDRRRSYVSGQYEAKMHALRDFVASRLDREEDASGFEAFSTPDEVNQRFLHTAADLLTQFDDDADVLRGLASGGRALLCYFLDRAPDERWDSALELAKRIRAAGGGLPLGNLCDDDLLERLVRDASGADQTSSARAVSRLRRIGAAAAPAMIAAICDLAPGAGRQRLLGGLIEMDEDPGAAVDASLREPGPDDLVQALLSVLRERGDERAGAVVEELWPGASPPVRRELLHCALVIHHPRRRERLRAMLFSPNRYDVLVAARLVSLYPEGGAIDDLVDRIRADGPWRQGSRLQLRLLGSLALSRCEEARTLLQGCGLALRPRLPWRRRRVQRAVARWLKGSPRHD